MNSTYSSVNSSNEKRGKESLEEGATQEGPSRRNSDGSKRERRLLQVKWITGGNPCIFFRHDDRIDKKRLSDFKGRLGHVGGATLPSLGPEMDTR